MTATLIVHSIHCFSSQETPSATKVAGASGRANRTNDGRRIAFALVSSAIYGVLASIAIATTIVDFQGQGQEVTWSVFMKDLKLIGSFLFLPTLILGGIGGAALLGFRKSTQSRLTFTGAGGVIGAILGMVFIGLSFLFDPTTSPNAAGNAPASKVFVMAVEVGCLVGVSYAMIFYRWIKAPGS